VRKGLMLLGIFLGFAATAKAQLMHFVPVQAGTPEGNAVKEINAATDPAQKLALIDKFQADLGTGNGAILANELYITYYLDAKNYDKTAEFAEKQLAIDPNNFYAADSLFRAEDQLHDTAKLFDAGERAGTVIAHYKSEQAPADSDAGWAAQHLQGLTEQHDEIEYIERATLQIVYQTQPPAARAALAERFVAAFPDSPYAASSEGLAAGIYSQLQDNPKMIAAAEKALALDPNSGGMLILLADYYSSSGKELDKAAELAKKAIAVLPQAAKPDGISDADWKRQTQLQTGLAWSAEGQVLVNKHDLDGAVAAFQKASPLLKPDQTTYARNLYRLGYTLALEKKTPEAKAALTEAASFNTPYKQPALDTLSKLTAAPKRQ
jgi:tetratricopeptide (TPR) repeat protein